MIKLIITSGCSFTYKFWPYELSKIFPQAKLINTGTVSASNDYILRSATYQISNALSEGYAPDEILAINMWSGIDRKGVFVSEYETANYESLINTQGILNPVNMWEKTSDIKRGWLLGSLRCKFANDNINKHRKEINKLIHTYEGFAHDSFQYFLSFQTLCESLGIRYMNCTFSGLMHYPSNAGCNLKYVYDQYCWITYESLKMYTTLLKFDTHWAFWKDHLGLYEFMCDGGYEPDIDGIHPGKEVSRRFVTDIILRQYNKIYTEETE